MIHPCPHFDVLPEIQTFSKNAFEMWKVEGICWLQVTTDIDRIILVRTSLYGTFFSIVSIFPFHM